MFASDENREGAAGATDMQKSRGVQRQPQRVGDTETRGSGQGAEKKSACSSHRLFGTMGSMHGEVIGMASGISG